MTKRQRVLAALKHQPTDIVPQQVDFTIESRRKAVEYYHDPEIDRHIDNHLANVMYDVYDATLKEIRPDFFQDHVGVVWNRTADKDIGMVRAAGGVVPRGRIGQGQPIMRWRLVGQRWRDGDGSCGGCLRFGSEGSQAWKQSLLASCAKMGAWSISIFSPLTNHPAWPAAAERGQLFVAARPLGGLRSRARSERLCCGGTRMVSMFGLRGLNGRRRMTGTGKGHYRLRGNSEKMAIAAAGSAGSIGSFPQSRSRPLFHSCHRMDCRSNMR